MSADRMPDHLMDRTQGHLADRTQDLRPVDVSDDPPTSASLAWPEAVAITVLLLAVALLASGWIDPMLPWRR
ncbi:hypothetical protein SAMN05421678_102104 [Actinopolymorpha cephalotaxi]|uniref:Uncharacterized protein n=1 Tax=Actinopolymorpha cephalotaxi TaxID=504797 RepID=A0A1I2LJR9_9ACTN|nr:hypothetical protein [Actinopolymorpha cephalotaxi]NYH84924.1 hypothetical protein [Actinopolymorpha cephalotaxi]SFF77677.1 hypothetical protein SAMN05421678_102104 [Actinopolymorpha cephalotaxi]